MLTLRPASDLAFDDLLSLWNGAYAGYFVPLVFERAMLERHVRRSGLDLSRSVVGAIDGEDFGLSLVGFRGERAWIGGFGVCEPFRRRGLATRLMAAHLQRLDAQGVVETWLEVIAANPAREVYHRSGFEEVRELKLYEGEPVPGAPGRSISVAELAEAHASFNAVRPAWRRDMPTLDDAIRVEGASVLAVERGYAVAAMQGERLFVFDAAAEDVEAGERLLGALAAAWPGVSVRLVDQPAGSPLALACKAAGFSNPFDQWEMVRRA
jgi:ribosomal protein S18 acetylase RimI-like enzyme